MSEQRGAAIGRMVQSKGASYGNAYPRVARALKAMLEEEGVDAGTPLKLSEAQLRELPYVTRLLEKAARVLHGGPQALGEDAWVDVAGIALARLAEEGRRADGRLAPMEVERWRGQGWTHVATGPCRVACLENIDAPAEWKRAPKPAAGFLLLNPCPICASRVGLEVRGGGE